MPVLLRHGLVASFPVLALAACTTTTILAPPSGNRPDSGAVMADPVPIDEPDAAPAGETDAASAPDTSSPVDPSYPAKHTPIPLVDFNGGAIIQAVKVVTVTFTGDSHRAQLEQFGDTITATPWWDAVTEGYCSPPGSATCVGRGSSGGHVVVTTAPATALTDSAQGGPSTVQSFIKAKLAAGVLPVPTKNTLYAIYLPTGVSVTLDSASSCQQFGAYHNTLMLPAAGGVSIPVPYAIMPRCDSTLTTLTVAASHELIEAATDPDVGTNGVAYYMNDQLWGALGGEVGDVCVDFTGTGSDVIQESGFSVQRSWSNKAAKASHDPCLPAPATPYFNVAPVAASLQTSIAVGASATIELDAFSDGPMADWTVQAADFAQLQGGKSSLSFSFDKSTAHNGAKIQMTVKLLSSPPQGAAQYAIISRSGKNTHFWPALITAK